MDARIAPPFMEATDASRLVCVVVVSYQEYSLTLGLSELVRLGSVVVTCSERRAGGSTPSLKDLFLYVSLHRKIL